MSAGRHPPNSGKNHSGFDSARRWIPSKLHTDAGPGGKNYTVTQVLEIKTSTMNQGMLASTTRVSYKTHSCHLPKQPHTMAQVSKLWAFPHHSIQHCWRWFPDHMASTHIENSSLCKIGGCPVRASVLGHGEATCGGRRLRPVLASALEARVSLLTRINFKE